MGYYSNINPDLFALANTTAKTVLEIGCGAGTFARAYLDKNPTAHYIGVEYVASEAAQAKPDLTHVICANIEEDSTFAEIDAALEGRKIDLLIIGDVLEHLLEPTSVMQRIHDRMAPNGRAEICVPNIAHWSIVMRLFRGDWTYEDNGLLDRTHLRFFTKDTMQVMFDDAGWTTRRIKPRIFGRDNGLKHARAFAKLSKELGFDAQKMAQNTMPLQWVFSLSATPQPKPIKVHAIGIGTKIDALSKVRVHQPWASLSSAGGFTPTVVVGSFENVPDRGPGILSSYRLHPQSAKQRAHVLEKCKEGWLFVHDVDDHPAYLKGQVSNNFWSIKNAHAVTVSTPALVEVCKQWNPNVFLVENQIAQTSPRDVALRAPNEKPVLFFGALNREKEWKAQCQPIVDYLNTNSDKIVAKILHEPSMYEALKDQADCSFVPTQTYEGFTAHLAASDISVLPLFHSEFNDCKSDLKVIECLAHGVVPICSPYAAAQTTVPNEHLCIAETPEDWAQHLHTLIHNPNLLADMKKAGYAYVRANRMWSAHTPALSSLFKQLFVDQKTLEQQRQSRSTG